jgi:hypothetical protein
VHRKSSQILALLGALALGSASFPARDAAAGLTLVEVLGTNAAGLGHSVAAAGDVNGDGWPDLIVGHPFDNTLGAQAGRAFVWFGGPNLRFAPDVILTQGSSGDWFGWSVAGIGDVNDDGYDDVAVGAPGDVASDGETGSAWIYFGGPNFDGSQSRKFSGEIGGDRFGWSVSAAGDMNRDGIDDFVVGAPYYDGPVVDSGRAYLFLGDRSTISPTPARSWDGPSLSGPSPTASTTDFADFAPDGIPIGGPAFGWSLAFLPNFRGDGRASVAIGAPGAAGAQGRAYLFFASSTAGGIPATTANVTFTNNVADQQFGWSVASGGRINGDSLDDLLVGAPGAFTDRGYVRVFYGASSPSAEIGTPSLERSGAVSPDRFGFSVAGIGDYDGNGGDWLVGAPTRNADGIGAGWVYRFDRTNATAVNVQAVNRSGSGVAGDRWGFSVSGAGGDLDGDGRDDFFVGAPDANNGAGAVRGNVAIVTAGPGVVSVPMVELAVQTRQDGHLDLFLASPLLARASHAELHDRISGSVIARLGENLQPEYEGMRAVLEAKWSGHTVQLQWTVDGIDLQQEFTLPSPVARSLLHPAAPNPFNPRTRIRFEVPRDQDFVLRVVDARGRVVRTLAQGVGTGAPDERTFDGRDHAGAPLASGAYVVELRTVGRVQSTRVVLVQ